MELAAFRARFPVVSKQVYLNSAAVGPLSDHAARAAARALEEQADEGSGLFARYEPAVERTRQKVARLIGAAPDEIAFMRNTVEALSTVASGLDWRSGDNVVASALEFSGNAYPWLNVECLGVECRFVPAPNGGIDIDTLMKATDRRTRVITVSLVQFSNGFRVDLEQLAARCRECGIRLVVDGIQGVGVVPVDVRASGVDFLACGAHKWLCAPVGIGFLYVNRERLPEIRLTEVGHGSVLPVPGTYTDYRFELHPDARRFEAGVTSYAGILGFEAALDLLERIGIGQVHAQIRALTTHLAGGLRARGYHTRSAQPAALAAGIVSFTSNRWTSEEIRARLVASGIAISLREGAIRVAPHAFNTISEIDALLAALP